MTFNPQNPEEIIELNYLGARPKISDLMFLLKQARGNPNYTIVQGWFDSVINRSFQLTCIIPMGEANPTWTVWMVVKQNKTPLMKQVTSDIKIINENLIKIETIQYEAILGTQSVENDPRQAQSQNVSDQRQSQNQFINDPRQAQSQNVSDQRQSQNQFINDPRQVQSQNVSGQRQSQNQFINDPRQAQSQNVIGQRQSQSQFINQQHLNNYSSATQGIKNPLEAPDPILGQINSSNAGLGRDLISASSMLEGDLSQMPFQTLLQSIANANLNGKLEVSGASNKAEVFFQSGLPYHAYLMGEIGISAIKEIFSWTNGGYVFLTDVTSNHKTVDKDIISLITEGLTYAEQKHYLESKGMSYDILIDLKKQNIQDSELKAILVKGINVDFNVQKQIYNFLNSHNQILLNDFIRETCIQCDLWVGTLYNFHKCGLIEFIIKPPEKHPLEFIPKANQASLEVYNSFINKETLIMNFAPGLYFLEYEYYRHKYYGYPLTICVINVYLDFKNNNIQSLPAQAQHILLKRVDLVKRPLDTFCQMNNNEYLLILPNSKITQATFIANRIWQNVVVSPLLPGIDKNNVKIYFGIASLPHDGKTIEELYSAAYESLNRGIKADFPLAMSSGKGSN